MPHPFVFKPVASLVRQGSVLLLGVLLLLPLFTLMWMSLPSLQQPEALTHFFQTLFKDMLTQTLAVCVGVVVLTSSMGLLTAWWVTAYDFPLRPWWEAVLLLPLAVPAYVIAYAYTDAFQFSGPIQSMLRMWDPSLRLPDIRSLPGAIAVLSFVLYPYVYLLARTAFLERSPHMLDAARSLGCNGLQAFVRVALPVARPAWAAGLALVLMETLSEYGALSYFGVQTFTTALFKVWLNLGDRASASLIALFLLAAIALLMVVENRARGRARYYTQGARAGRAQRRLLKGWKAAVVFFLCAMPSVLGFFLPTVLLLSSLLNADLSPPWAANVQWLGHTALLGLVSAALALAVALGLAYARRSRPGRVLTVLHKGVSIGYGVPGAVIAIALLIVLSRVDQALNDVGWAQGLVVSSGMTGLVYAYLIRFTSAPLQSLDAGLERITPSMDQSARSLGCSASQVVRRVHWPMLKGALASGVFLVVVDVIKELPATLVLRPFDFDTLAVVAHQLAADERLAEAALPALTIVGLALIPLAFLMRQTLQLRNS